MRRVIIESPFKADKVEDANKNIFYARRALLHSLKQNEAPFASHLLYSQVLNEFILSQRLRGIQAGFQWIPHADVTVIYTDLGISDGMKLGIRAAEDAGIPVEFRKLSDG